MLSVDTLLSDQYIITLIQLIFLAVVHTGFNVLLRNRPITQKNAEKEIRERKRKEQFREEGWQFLFHTFALFSKGIHIPGITVWGMDMDVYDEDSLMQHQVSEKLAYYRQYLFFYFYLFALTVIDKDIGKRYEMLLHHGATVQLMYFAGIMGYLDISVYVLYINNVADIFLGPSKIFNIFKNVLRVPFFVGFTFAHLVLRCIYFPYNIYRMSCHEKTGTLFDRAFIFCIPLFGLNYFWAYHICKTCLNFFKAPNKRIIE